MARAVGLVCLMFITRRKPFRASVSRICFRESVLRIRCANPYSASVLRSRVAHPMNASVLRIRLANPFGDSALRIRGAVRNEQVQHCTAQHNSEGKGLLCVCVFSAHPARALDCWSFTCNSFMRSCVSAIALSLLRRDSLAYK